MAALGQMQGVLLGNKCPFTRPPFLHRLGECCLDKAGHAPGGISEPSVTTVGSLVPLSISCSSLPAARLAACPCQLLTLSCRENLPWAPRGTALAVRSAVGS